MRCLSGSLKDFEGKKPDKTTRKSFIKPINTYICLLKSNKSLDNDVNPIYDSCKLFSDI